MLRRTNFGMMVDDLGTKTEDEIALDYIVDTARSVGIAIIPGETAISIRFCAEVMRRLKSAKKKKKKRPRCPNGYNCSDCIHADEHWEELKFRGFSCRIDAK